MWACALAKAQESHFVLLVVLLLLLVLLVVPRNISKSQVRTASFSSLKNVFAW